MERVTKFACECQLLHDTKAKAQFCTDNQHFAELLSQGPDEEKDPYGKVLGRYVWERVESEIGAVLVRRKLD